MRDRVRIAARLLMPVALCAVIGCGGDKKKSASADDTAPRRGVVAHGDMMADAEDDGRAAAGFANFAPGRDMRALAESAAGAPMDALARRALDGGAVRMGIQPDAPEPVTGETYEDAGENTFIVTGEDALSTFAIDVDTAAYTLMRDDILRYGRLPATAGVRVEEYVNYFDYDYAPPASADTPFAVHLEAAPSPFAADRTLLRVGVKGYEVADDARKPANLVFLVDVSGSMGQANKLPLVVTALKKMLPSLNPDDTLSLVTYASSDRVVLEPTPVSDIEAIEAALDGLRSGGGTAGAAGIQTAYVKAREAFVDGGINRVILCTDGDFNIGLRGDALIEEVARQRDGGIALTTLLFGRGNINDAMVEQLANRADGNYAFIDTDKEAERALGQRVMSTLQTIAKDVKIQVEFDPNVVARYRLVGYENRAIADNQFRDDAVDAGELGAGHSVTAIYELELTDGAAADGTLATVRLRWKSPDATSEDEAAETDTAMTVNAIHSNFTGGSDDFRFACAVMQHALVCKRSTYISRPAYEELIAIAESAQGDHEDRAEFIRIAIQASDIPALYEEIDAREAGPVGN